MIYFNAGAFDQGKILRDFAARIDEYSKRMGRN